MAPDGGPPARAGPGQGTDWDRIGFRSRPAGRDVDRALTGAPIEHEKASLADELCSCRMGVRFALERDGAAEFAAAGPDAGPERDAGPRRPPHLARFAPVNRWARWPGAAARRGLRGGEAARRGLRGGEAARRVLRGGEAARSEPAQALREPRTWPDSRPRTVGLGGRRVSARLEACGQAIRAENAPADRCTSPSKRAGSDRTVHR